MTLYYFVKVMNPFIPYSDIGHLGTASILTFFHQTDGKTTTFCKLNGQ